MGSAAKSVSGIAVEQQQSGLYALLAATAVSALPASLTNTIASSGTTTGMRLLIVAFGHTASGTISIAGTAPLTDAAINETTSTLPVPEVPGDSVYYMTSTVFQSVGASGVTVTGLTGGSVVIYGLQVAKRLLPGEFKLMDKIKEISPVEQRGSFDHDFHLLGLTKETAWEHSGDFYPDQSLFLLFGGYNAAPTVTNLPNPGTAILASTPVTTGASASAALQPLAPGQILQCVISGTPTTAATVTIVGTDEYGEAITEIVVPSTKTAGTFYSANRFASIGASGITYGAFGTGVTLTITGYNGFQLSGNPGDTLASFAAENYDSTASFGVPWCLIDEWTIEGGQDKELKITAKGPCQNVYQVGVTSTATNQITAFAQNVDAPMTGWQSLVYIDGITGTAGTTQSLDVVDFKITVKLDQVFKYTSWSNPPGRIANRAYRKRRHVEVELTLDETSTTYANEYTAFTRRQLRLFQLQLRGPLLGAVSSVNYYAGPTITVPLRWVEEAARDYTTGKESPEVKLKGVGRYTPALGYSHKITWNTRYNAW